MWDPRPRYSVRRYDSLDKYRLYAYVIHYGTLIPVGQYGVMPMLVNLYLCLRAPSFLRNQALINEMISPRALISSSTSHIGV